MKYASILLALLLVGGIRIAATYSVFNHTFDEPAHISGGVEWWDLGTYTREPMHPPLPRIAEGLGPYLDGARALGPDSTLVPENDVLYEGIYWRRLTLARIGNLLFFFLAAGAVWTWGRWAYGVGAAVVATALFTTLPPILAHSGIATTDMSVTAALAWAFYFYVRWLQAPRFGTGFALGIALGFAALAKMSAVLYFPAGALAILVFRVLIRSREPEAAPGGVYFTTLVLAGVLAFGVLWAGYRFSHGPLTVPEKRPHDPIAGLLSGQPEMEDLANRLVEAPLYPIPEFVRGLNQARAKNRTGHAGMLLEERLENKGNWAFFPVALGVKSPIAFLILSLAGVVVLVFTTRGDRDRFAPVAAAAAILAVAMTSNINLGVRHVLAVYPLLSLSAGAAAMWAFRRPRTALAPAALLVAWHLYDSARAHPDYLAYMNNFVTEKPQYVLADSDLDWGQDLYRLGKELEKRDIPEIALAYFGTADPDRAGLPPHRTFDPRRPQPGWVAVSRTRMALDPAFDWMKKIQPAFVVGGSIEVYDLKADQLP